MYKKAFLALTISSLSSGIFAQSALIEMYQGRECIHTFNFRKYIEEEITHYTGRQQSFLGMSTSVTLPDLIRINDIALKVKRSATPLFTHTPLYFTKSHLDQALKKVLLDEVYNNTYKTHVARRTLLSKFLISDKLKKAASLQFTQIHLQGVHQAPQGSLAKFFDRTSLEQEAETYAEEINKEIMPKLVLNVCILAVAATCRFVSYLTKPSATSHFNRQTDARQQATPRPTQPATRPQPAHDGIRVTGSNAPTEPAPGNRLYPNMEDEEENSQQQPDNPPAYTPAPSAPPAHLVNQQQYPPCPPPTYEEATGQSVEPSAPPETFSNCTHCGHLTSDCFTSCQYCNAHRS